MFKQQIAQSITCSDNNLQLTSIFTCSVTLKPDTQLDKAEDAFWRVVSTLQKDGPTQDELDAARTVDLTQKISGLQELGGFGGVADTLDSYNQYTGDPGYLSKDIARFQAVTVAGVKDAAAKYLNQNQAVVVTTVPGSKVVDDVPRSPDSTDADVKLVPPYTADFEAQQSWRKNAPGAGPVPAVHLPIPTLFTLKNGLKVYLVQDTSLPVMSVSVVSRAGDEVNPADRPGLAGIHSTDAARRDGAPEFDRTRGGG